MLYERGDISVDDRFARFGAKSYAINKITSVDVRSETRSGSNGFILWWLFAAGMLAWAVTQLSVVPLVFAGLFGWLGWGSWQRRHPVVTYRLFLVSTASEAQAFTTNDKDELISLRRAIEDAMSRSS